MSYLLNYKNWRALHEAVNTTNVKPVTPGNELTQVQDWIAFSFDKTVNATATTIRTKIMGKEAIPDFRVATGSGSATALGYQDQVFGAILDGVSIATGGTSLDNENLGKAEELAKKAEFSLEAGEVVQLYGPPLEKPDGMHKINTVGSVSANIAKAGKTSSSYITAIAAYINSFNLQNWMTGDFTQYDPTKILNDNKLVDLTAQSPAIVKERGFLMLVGRGATSITGGTIGTSVELPQGKEANTGSVEIAFYVGKADTDDKGVKVDANHPKVQEIGKMITDYLGKTGVIDSMVLTSSASPEFAPEKGGPKTLADYATKKKPTSGNAAPASVVDLYDQNAKLAYDRGVTFSNALQQYLGGHLKANSIKVAWKISTDEPGGGRNISYNIATKSEAPQPIERTTFQGAEVKTESKEKSLYVYKVKYNASAFGEIEKGGLLKKGMVPYEKLKIGDQIIIKNKEGNAELGGKKDENKVTISKIQDNKIYINYKDQKDVEIPKERYIRQLGKAKEEGPDLSA